VKKLISILLISSFLISSTEFYQILKVPFLLEHFKEHKSLNEGTTFWSFLSMHYSNNDIKYADYEKDMRLPFKSSEGSLHLLSISFINYFSTTKLHKPFAKTLKTYKIFNDHKFQSSYLSNIWQPPKSC
jgi:hypothetical protein